MIKGACYVRVSTENQLENYSIEEQTERLKAYCLAKDIIVTKFYTDGGYSGGNTNRPALQQLLSDIKGGCIDIVIVYKLDRLSRSQKDTLTLIEDHFLANHVDFISISENFDTSTPFGRAMIGILSVFAQLEKDQITERFTMGRIGRAKSGLYHGGPTAPTGYDYVNGKLVVNEYEALQVRELFERFAKGYSLNNCWQYMRKKYTTKYGAWTSDALVRNVLKNTIYIGYVKFNGTAYPGVHEPIISKELFDEVQEIFEKSRRSLSSYRRSPFRATTLLASMVYCGKCGARYHGEHGNYSCYSRTKGDAKYVIDPNCKNKKWKIPELDNVIIDYITKFDFEKIRPRNVVPASPRKDYTDRIDSIDRQISKLIDLYQIGSIPMDTLSGRIDALTREKNTLLAANQKPEKAIVTAAELMEFRDRFLHLLDHGSLEEKRACLARIVDRIIVNDDSVQVILK